jgi:ATP phosphoribosyltransferase
MTTQASLDEQIEEVARGVCMRNAELLGSGMSIREILTPSSRVGIAMPAREWVSCNIPYIEQLPLTSVLLSSRDVAKALELGELDVGITWPSLLAEESLTKLNVISLGCFPVHYGFLLGESAPARGYRVAVQYRHAFARHAGAATPFGTATYEIEGLAEEWIERGLADAAYDSYRTGRTSSRRGLQRFFPTHWETLAAIYAK